MTNETLEQVFEAAEQTDDFWLEQASINLTDDLERIMVEKGVSQAELARRMGSTRPYVNRVIHGRENLTVASMVKIARALGKRINFYFSEQNAQVKVTEQGKREAEANETVEFRWGRKGPSTTRHQRIRAEPVADPQSSPGNAMWFVRHG